MLSVLSSDERASKHLIAGVFWLQCWWSGVRDL